MRVLVPYFLLFLGKSKFRLWFLGALFLNWLFCLIKKSELIQDLMKVKIEFKKSSGKSRKELTSDKILLKIEENFEVT